MLPVFLSFLVLGLNTLFAHAQITGGVSIINHCADTVYIWSISSTVGPSQTIPPTGYFGENFRTDPISGGITLAMSKDPDGINNGSPQFNFQYIVDIANGNQAVWYEFASLRGSPFEGQRVWVGGDACPVIDWKEGVKVTDTLKACFINAEMLLYLCGPSWQSDSEGLGAKGQD
ncbi:hypothetical protein K504DRAFT_461176 [Pleomassaria siparia CBS 279.74]|uniref:BYS1 domain protein n=1 Tax=Pleomassaria siparia CBS 279.74 TaxID=1314801 RepID=A0A6G1JUY1_9PLEO|nr:hypothetical protein K504DRAFT_461176 [Pleomassaria siparia CBS 279.74]